MEEDNKTENFYIKLYCMCKTIFLYEFKILKKILALFLQFFKKSATLLLPFFFKIFDF